jgi:hypothetical protein
MKEKISDSLLLTHGAVDLQAGYVFVYLLKDGKVIHVPIQCLSFYQPKSKEHYILCLDLGIYSYADTLENATKQLLELMKVLNSPENAGKKIIPFEDSYYKIFNEKKKALSNIKVSKKPFKKLNISKTKIKDEISLALCS